jgi:hypothetical protein
MVQDISQSMILTIVPQQRRVHPSLLGQRVQDSLLVPSGEVRRQGALAVRLKPRLRGAERGHVLLLERQVGRKDQGEIRVSLAAASAGGRDERVRETTDVRLNEGRGVRRGVEGLVTEDLVAE